MDAEPIQTDATTSADAEPTDADLIAAAQAAGGAASVDVDAEQAAATARVADAASPKPTGTPGVPAAATGEPEEPKIAALIRAREKANAERLDAQDFAAQTRQKAQQEADEIRAQARKQAAADYEADLQARRAKFRESPAATLREFGIPTEQLVDAVTQEGTATFRAIRAAEARAAAAEAKAGTVDAVKADFETFKNQIALEAQQARVMATEREFLTTHAAPEKAPYLHKRYEPGEILEKAHALAREWRTAGIPFANGDVAEYLEHQARQRLAGVPVPAQQVSAGGSGQKVRPNGSRTLSPASGSERRASPKPIEEMNPDEERQALIEAAAEARRTGGG